MEHGDRDSACASFGWLRIELGDQVITHHRTDNNQVGDEVQVPLYYLAEWIALNWWPLLYEPKKTDNAEQDFDFRARHWIGVARHGFSLPDTWIIPAGDKIEVSTYARRLPATRLSFTESARAALRPPVVKEALASFVDKVSKRLRTANISGTVLQDAWAAVRETPPESEEFCRLMGSLGLSPYDQGHPEIESLLDRLADTLGTELLRDLCEAVAPTTLERVAQTASRVWAAVTKAPCADLSNLQDCPGDSTSERAARWGLQAAFKARRYLGIRPADPHSGDAFFEAIKLPSSIDNVPRLPVANQLITPDLIAGAVDRRESAMRFALVDNDVSHRRFAGARAAFLAWSGKRQSSRLLTDARTRDQQASRAFAAEILAPKSFIKSKAQNGVLTETRVYDLAEMLRVSPLVIENQAKNAGLYIH
jgi:hypothetical protein